MENMTDPPTPRDAAAALAEAETSRAQFADGLALPSFFYSSIGVTVAVQIATAAVEVGFDTGWTRLLAIAGAAVFALMAGIQLARFRRLNGVWLGGLTSRVLLATGRAAGASYALALGIAFWAAHVRLWWLAALGACAGGLAYTLSGRRWLRLYMGDPAAHARAEAAGWLVAVSALAVAALTLMVVGS